jgi:hypothetical protein
MPTPDDNDGTDRPSNAEQLQEMAKDLPKDRAIGRFGSEEQSDEGGDSDTASDPHKQAEHPPPPGEPGGGAPDPAEA